MTRNRLRWRIVSLVAVLALALGASASPTGGQSGESDAEVIARQQRLIIHQEALINEQRALISAQELLLNDYRCMFKVDTQLVPDGCGEPEVAEPEDTEPEIVEPEDTEPEVVEPEDTEPEVVEPEDTEPEVVEPEDTEPEDTQPEDTEPEDTQPEIVEPEDEDTVATLLRNAEEFTYELGTHGGTATFATFDAPLGLNPEVIGDSGSARVLSYLFEGLTELSWLDGAVEPLLAESWEHSDDALTWTFHLREDVVWHDGTPFTAHDVVFTYNEIIYGDFGEDFRASSRSLFEFHVENPDTGEEETAQMTVTALDDHTVEIVLPQPYAPFIRSMGTWILPKHIFEGPINDGTFEDFWSLDTDPSEIIGTGPFTLAELTLGEQIVYERNPDYWLTDEAGNRLPYLDRVVEILVTDFVDELPLFREGISDAEFVTGDEYAELALVAEAENFTIHKRGPTFSSTLFVFNQNPGSDDDGQPFVEPAKLRWFQNLDFRRAVAHAVDKQAMIDLQDGLAYPQWSFVSPAAGEFHNPNVRQYPFDLEEAGRILDELGWVDTDGDGIREDDAGNPITFTFITNEDNNLRVGLGRIIERGLNELGIDAQFTPVTWGELLVRLLDTYDFEGVMIGWGGGPDPFSAIGMWHSSETYHLWYPNQPEPATEWEAEVDRLFVEASIESDHETRVQLYRQAQEIIAENIPLMYTTQAERLTAVRNVFGNTTATIFGIWDLRYLYRTDQ